MGSRGNHASTEMGEYMINWNMGPLGLILRPDLGNDMPPVVAQVLPGESVASLSGVNPGDMLMSINGKRTTKLGFEKAMRTLYKEKLPVVLHFRMPQTKMTSTGSARSHHSQHSHHSHHSQGHQSQSQSRSHGQQRQQRTSGRTHRTERTMSMLSSNGETREQKMKKQYSVVWESGSLGFSFRPYAPNVNVPTVDFIGDRGKGKNMDVVCVNDVLILINGQKTKNMGVERVLKMLHVLEKPVVLRFHKSSHRVENPQARKRSKSAPKVPAIMPERVSESLGVVEEQEAGQAVHFQMDDQIRLRSESGARAPPSSSTLAPASILASHSIPQPPQLSQSRHEEANGQMPTPIASQFAAQVASRSRRSSSAASSQPPQPPRPALMPPSSQQLPQPNTQAPVPIVVESQSSVSRQSSFITVEMARQIVAKSYGKTVETCEFGGIPLLQIQEGTMQARLLTTFAKACLAKEMKEHQQKQQQQQQPPQEQQYQQPPQQQYQQQPQQQYQQGYEQQQQQYYAPPPQVNHSFQHVSGNGLSVDYSSAFSHTPQNSAPMMGNPLAAGRPKYLTYSFTQSNGTRSMMTHDAQPTRTLLALPPSEPMNNAPYGSNTPYYYQPPQQQYQPSRPQLMAAPYQYGNQSNDNVVHAGTFVEMSSQSHQNGMVSQSAPSRLTVLSTAGGSGDNFVPLVNGNNHYSQQHQYDQQQYGQQQYDQQQYDQRQYEQPQYDQRQFEVVNDARASERFSQHQDVRSSTIIPLAPTESVQNNVNEQSRTSTRPSDDSAGGLTLSQLGVSAKDAEQRKSNGKQLGEISTHGEDLEMPKRITEMISLDSALILPADDHEAQRSTVSERLSDSKGTTQGDVEKTEDVEEQVLVPVVVNTPPPVERAEPEGESAVDTNSDDVDIDNLDVDINIHNLMIDVVDPVTPMSLRAHPDHPVIQQLCTDSRDLERVMVGHGVDMILLKKRMVEEIEDILQSLEMELQFERHSFVGVGRGSFLEPQVKRCYRCGKLGELADLALDSDHRERYCQECWEVYFFSETASPHHSLPSPSKVGVLNDEDFDPREYSIHDSSATGTEPFHIPWRYDSDMANRDSNVTTTSTITDHADEVWL